MAILRNLATPFGLLTQGSHIHYIIPLTGKIKYLVVHNVEEYNDKYVRIAYYKASNSLDLGVSIEALPTKEVFFPKNATFTITKTMPPGVYATTKRELEKWMK